MVQTKQAWWATLEGLSNVSTTPTSYPNSSCVAPVLTFTTTNALVTSTVQKRTYNITGSAGCTSAYISYTNRTGDSPAISDTTVALPFSYSDSIGEKSGSSGSLDITVTGTGTCA